MKDYILRTTAADGGIRLVAVLTTQSTKQAKKNHKLSFLSTAILGRAMTGGLLLASSMKVDYGRVIIKTHSNGPLKGLVADAGRDGTVRGYVGRGDLELDPIKTKNGFTFNFKKALGEGYLNVLRDEGKGQPHSSTVELVNGGIGEDLASYLLHSEQTPSAFFVGEKFINSQLICSGGLLAQVMPKAESDMRLVNLLEERCKKIKSFSNTLYENQNDLTQIFKYLFPGEDDNLSENIFREDVEFSCKCSRERSLSALKLLGKEELKDMLKKDKRAELICEFCKSIYLINEDELTVLINSISN